VATSNRKDIIDFIVAQEEDVQVNDWQVSGFELWPIVRIKLFFTLIFALEKHTSSESTSMRLSLRQKLGILVDSVFYRISIALKIKPVKTLYAGFFAHRISFKGKSFNRFFDPMLDKENGNGLLMEYERPKTKLDYYEKKRVIEVYRLFPFFSFTRKGNIDIDSSIVSQIKKVIEGASLHFGISLDVNKFLASLQSDINRVQVNKELYNFLFKKVKPSTVICLTYYNPSSMGIIAACKAMGIEVHEMQHGPQGALHAAYASWTKVPETGYQLLPDKFLCWNVSDASEINAWATSSKHKAIAFGNPWARYWKEGMASSSYNKWPRNLILYTLQPVDDIFEPYLVETIKALSSEYQWWIRLHPRQLGERRRIQEEIDRLDLASVVNIEDATSLPLPDIMIHSRVHITKYSGCFLEALEFDVPSVLIDERGVSIFKDYLNSSIVSVVLDHNSGSLQKVIQDLSTNRK